MGGFFGGDTALAESHEEPRVEEQTVKVAAVEGDDGVVTTTYNSVSNSLYDLADSRSKTYRVILPNGTTIALGSISKPGLGAYRSSFQVTPKGGTTRTVEGSQAAADLAYKLDLLSLSAKDRATILALKESELTAMAEEHLPKLEEKSIHVSGYVTKSGRHVGAYSQVRDILAKLKSGDTAHFPEGIQATRTAKGFEVKHPVKKGGAFPMQRTRHVGTGEAEDAPNVATKDILDGSAQVQHPQAIGGQKKYKDFETSQTDRSPKSGNIGGPEFKPGKYKHLTDPSRGKSEGGPSAAEANERIARAGKKRGPDSYAGMQVGGEKSTVEKGTDPVSKLKAGKVTRVGNYMIRENGQRAGVYTVTADDGIGASVHADSPEAAVRLAGRAQENPAEWAKATAAQRKAERAAAPKPGGGRRVIATQTTRGKEPTPQPGYPGTSQQGGDAGPVSGRNRSSRRYSTTPGRDSERGFKIPPPKEGDLTPEDKAARADALQHRKAVEADEKKKGNHGDVPSVGVIGGGGSRIVRSDPRKPAGTGFQKTSGGDAVTAGDLNTGDTVNFEGHDWKVKQITGGGGKPVNSVNVVPIRSDGSEGSVARTLEPSSKVNRVGKSKLGDLSGKGAVPGAKRVGGFKPGDKVLHDSPNSKGALTHTVVKIEGDKATIKTPDNPSLGGGKEKTVPVAQLRYKEGKGGAAETIDKGKGRRSTLGWDPNDSPMDQAKGMTAGTNHTKPEEWKEMYQRLTRFNESLKYDAIRAAWAHAISTGNKKMADRIMRTLKKADGRSSKSSRLVEEAAPDGGGLIRG